MSERAELLAKAVDFAVDGSKAYDRCRACGGAWYGPRTGRERPERPRHRLDCWVPRAERALAQRPDMPRRYLMSGVRLEVLKVLQRAGMSASEELRVLVEMLEVHTRDVRPPRPAALAEPSVEREMDGEIVLTSLGDGAEYYIPAWCTADAAALHEAFESMLREGGIRVPLSAPTPDPEP